MWEPEFIVNFDMVIIHLTGIWDDKKERLYFSVFLEGEEKGKKKYSNMVIMLNSALKEIGRIKLIVQRTPHEIWKSVKVSSDGKIYQLLVDKPYVKVIRYELNY